MLRAPVPEFSSYEQPVKSSRAAVVVAPGVTFRGMGVADESLLVVCDGIVQIVVADKGFVASASTLYRTSPVAGGVIVVLPAENVPTVGLLAGTTNE